MKRKSNWRAVAAALLAAALIIAAGLCIPALILSRHEAAILAQTGVVKASAIDPYSHRTTQQRIQALAALIGDDPDAASWSTAREPFQNELPRQDAEEAGRRIVMELLVFYTTESRLIAIPSMPEDLTEDWPWTSVRFLSAPDETTLAVWRLERDGLRLLIDAGSGLPVYGCVGVADSGPYVEDAWWVTAEVLRMLYTDAIPGVQGDDLTTELQSSGNKAVFSAAGTLTAPYTLRMQMTWLPAEAETGGSYEFPQTFYVDGRFYTAEKLEFFLSA